MTETVMCFSCCVANNSPQRKNRRRKLDPSMIGPPGNFQHLNHIGSGESGGNEMQQNMQSKGGYEFKSDVHVQRKLTDLKSDAS